MWAEREASVVVGYVAELSLSGQVCSSTSWAQYGPSKGIKACGINGEKELRTTTYQSWAALCLVGRLRRRNCVPGDDGWVVEERSCLLLSNNACLHVPSSR